MKKAASSYQEGRKNALGNSKKGKTLYCERILTETSAGPIVAQLFFFFSSVIWEPYALLCLSIFLINEPVH